MQPFRKSLETNTLTRELYILEEEDMNELSDKSKQFLTNFKKIA